eukprot:Skav210197  [mRNA]  locus=scaffold1264:67103:68563:+ [translate_table: standard]
MESPTVSALKIANEIKAHGLSDGAVFNEEDFTKPLSDAKPLAVEKPPKTSASSSSTTTYDLQWLQGEIQRLEALNQDMAHEIKLNKATLTEYKKQMKEAPITIHVRRPSGQTHAIQTKASKTVKQFKLQDLLPSMNIDLRDYTLVSGLDVMLNRRRLFAYGVVDGFTIDLVLTNRNIVESSTDTEQDFVVMALDGQAMADDAIDSEVAEDDGMEHFLCEAEKVVGRLEVVVPRNSKEDVLTFAYGTMNTASEIFDIIDRQYGLKQDDYVLKYTRDGLSVLCGYDGLYTYFTAGGRVYLNAGLKGGVKQVFLKKHEALAHLKKRIQDNTRRSDAVLNMENLPEHMQGFVNGIVNEVGQMQMLQTQGVSVVRFALSRCSTNVLTEIEGIADIKKGRNGNHEERVSRIVSLIYPALNTIEEMKDSLEALQAKVAQDLLELFINEYHSYADGKPARMDLASFSRDLQNLKKDREPNSVATASNPSSCTAM